MIYTALYLIFILVLAIENKDREAAIRKIIILSIFYWGLRYNYQNDYEAYHNSFEWVKSMDSYDKTAFHAEYGWWLLYKLFQPLGYYVFVFVCSAFLIYALVPWFKKYANDGYLWIVSLGLFSAPYFKILSSAQRQWLVSAIFLLAFFYFIRGRISGYKDLIKKNVLIYFFFIFLCRYFHTSALFLLIIPFLYLIPKNSKIVAISFIVLFLLEMTIGRLFIQDTFGYLVASSGSYDYLEGRTEGAMEEMSVINWIMNIFQFLVLGYIYMKGKLDDDESVILILTVLAILINSTVFFVPEMHRISMYFVFFQYISIGIILSKMKEIKSGFYTPSLVMYTVWIGWNIVKIVNVIPGTTDEYKCVLSLLFS